MSTVLSTINPAINSGADVTLTKSGLNHLALIVGAAKTSNNVGSINSITLGNAVTVHTDSPRYNIGSVSLNPVICYQSDLDIQENAQTLSVGWNITTTEDFFGTVILLNGVSTTNPIADLDIQTFGGGGATARSYNAVAGDTLVYVYHDTASTGITAPPGWVAAAGPPNSGTNQIDQGIIIYRELTANESGTVIAENLSGGGSGGHHFVFVVKNFVASVDVTPDQFDLGADVTDAALGAVTTRSFTAAGIDEAITWTATDDALVSLAPSSGFGASVSADAGTTIYVQLTASGINSTSVTGGVTAGGISDSFSVTTVSSTPAGVSSTDPILDASTNNSLVVENFGSNINSVLIQSGVHSTSVINLTGAGDNYTWDAPDISLLSSDTAGAPFTTNNHSVSLVFSDGVDTASLPITRSPKAGWVIQEVQGAVKTEGSIFETVIEEVPDQSIIYYEAVNGTSVDATGTIITFASSDFVIQWLNSTTGIWKQIIIEINTVDSTPPIISLPLANNIAETGVTPQVTTDEGNGTAYMVVVPNGDIPSVAQIKAGQQSNGSAAIATENISVSSVGVIAFSPITGLSTDTEYEIYFVHTDAASNDSSLSTIGFSTLTDTTIPTITLLGNAIVNSVVGNAYIDAGATASDNIDGNITTNIVTVNPVDINTPGQYIVTYNVSDAAGNDAFEVSRTVNITPVQDTTPPEITLLGDSVVNTQAGESYIDAGATASDDVDGNITGNIITVNPVDTNTIGQYIITYDVQDSSGNDATQVIRTVNVIDTNIPVIDLLGSAVINIELGSNYVDAGATASDSFEGDITGSIITVNNVNTSVLGLYLVTYDVQDSSGNNANQVTRSVNVNQPPVAGSLNIEGLPIEGINIEGLNIIGKNIGDL